MYSYRRKVSGASASTTYLWGSSSTAQVRPAVHAEQIVLVVGVEETGDPISLSFHSRNTGQIVELGILEAGEVFGIPLSEVDAVFATPASEGSDSSVLCSLLPTGK